MQFRSKILILLIIYTSEGLSQNLPRTDIRESCRRAVSGLYLTTWDNQERAERYIISTTKRLKEVNKSLLEQQKKLRTIDQKINKSPFDIDLTNKRSSVENMINSLKDSKEQFNALQIKAKKEFQIASKKTNELKKNISKVFKITGSPNSEKGYQLAVQYLDKCPKYRSVCPLPPNKSQHLLNIFKKEKETPTSCRHYAGIR